MTNPTLIQIISAISGALITGIFAIIVENIRRKPPKKKPQGPK